MKIGEDGTEIPQPIAFTSQKFSDPATRWSTIHQECYAMFHSVKRLQYYLRGKFFELETDHANLQWLERSENPAIVRMRIFMQEFVTKIRHISGSTNRVADYMSRVEMRDSPGVNLCYLLHKEGVRQLHLCMNDDYEGSPLPIQAFDAYLMLMIADEAPMESEPTYLAPIARSGASYQAGEEEKEVVDSTTAELDEVNEKLDAALKECHNSRRGHRGAEKTWKLLNELYPDNAVTLQTVKDFIRSCPICQKDRIKQAESLPQMYRTVKAAQHRHVIGIDHTKVSPKDHDGNNFITAVVNMFTGRTMLFPAKKLTAEHTMRCIHKYITTMGMIDEIRTDPGSDFTSTAIAQLRRYLDIKHTIGIVDWHPSNGVERVIQEVKRRLRAIVLDENLMGSWSDPLTLSTVEMIINVTPLSERGGYTAFQLTYGSNDQTPHRVEALETELQERNSDSAWSQIMRKFDESLRKVRSSSARYQQALCEKRKSPAQRAGKHPQFIEGELVIVVENKNLNSESLRTRNKGPYEVVRQRKNDVTLRFINGRDEEFDENVSRLRLWSSRDHEEDVRMANSDHDENVVIEVLAYKGDIYRRTDMYFYVRYDDGTEKWEQYQPGRYGLNREVLKLREFCGRHPELEHLMMTDTEARRMIRDLDSKIVQDLEPNDVFYLDLRYQGWFRDPNDRNTWLNDRPGLDYVNNTYLIKCIATRYSNNGKVIMYRCPVLDGDKENLLTNFEAQKLAYRRGLSSKETLVGVREAKKFKLVE